MPNQRGASASCPYPYPYASLRGAGAQAAVDIVLLALGHETVPAVAHLGVEG